MLNPTNEETNCQISLSFLPLNKVEKSTVFYHDNVQSDPNKAFFDEYLLYPDIFCNQKPKFDPSTDPNLHLGFFFRAHGPLLTNTAVIRHLTNIESRFSVDFRGTHDSEITDRYVVLQRLNAYFGFALVEFMKPEYDPNPVTAKPLHIYLGSVDENGLPKDSLNRVDWAYTSTVEIQKLAITPWNELDTTACKYWGGPIAYEWQRCIVVIQE